MLRNMLDRRWVRIQNNLPLQNLFHMYTMIKMHVHRTRPMRQKMSYIGTFYLACWAADNNVYSHSQANCRQTRSKNK